MRLSTAIVGNRIPGRKATSFLECCKTHSVLFSTKQKHDILKGQNESSKLKICDNELEVVKKTKYLGLQVDCSLDWKEQFLPRSSGQLDFQNILSSFLLKETLETLYTSIVASLSILLLYLGPHLFNRN